MKPKNESVGRAAWKLALASFTRGAWPINRQYAMIPTTMLNVAEILDARQCFAERFGKEGSLEVELATELAKCHGTTNMKSPEAIVETAFDQAVRLNSAEMLSTEQAKRSRALECLKEAEEEKLRREKAEAEAARLEAERRSAEFEKERKALARTRKDLKI